MEDRAYRFRTLEGTATADVDYQADSGTVTIKSGEALSDLIVVVTLQDDIDEHDEGFAVEAEAVGENFEFQGGLAVFTIKDNDPRPVLSIGDAPAAVEAAASWEFTVTLSEASGRRVSVDYATSDGTAAAGNDYTATSGTLVFMAGEVTKTVLVPVLSDESPEDDETFTVGLANADYARLGRRSATGTIFDDDPTVTVVGGEAAEAEGSLEFVVSVRGGGSQRGTVTVNYATSDRTALAGSDYTATSGVLTFPPDLGEATVTVTVLDDWLEEPDETVAVTLAGAVNAVIGEAESEGTIRNDDVTTTAIILGAVPSRVTEGAGATAVTVTASLDGSPLAQATTVTVTVSGSGAADAADFAVVSDFTLTIPSGATSGTGMFTLVPEDDLLDEADERLSIAGTSDLPVRGTAVTLADDDATSTVIGLSAVPTRVSEGAGSTAVAVTATLDRSARTAATPITLSVAASGAAGTVGFGVVGDFEIEIPANALRGAGTFTVTPQDDGIAETDEVLTVSGTADLRVTPAMVTLLDDDVASTRIVLRADRSSLTEDGGAVEVTVTASLDRDPRPRSTQVTVTVTGSGSPDAVDFEAVAAFRIGIAAGATIGAGMFEVRPEDDAEVEADETLTISGASDLPVTPVLLSLTDDDDRPRQTFRVLLFESAANPKRQGFLRVINHSAESGEVRIDAVDDGGVERAPVMLAVGAGKAAHFNSDDLENGNAEKGLSGGVGTPSRGEWRLRLSSELDIEVLAYARTRDGFVTAMHHAAPVGDGEHRVSFFNPGRNQDQASRLRLVNIGAGDAEATLSGLDDAGVAAGEVQVEVPAGTVLTLTAAELESGVAEGIVAGALGPGTGKWRLTVNTSSPLAVKSLLASPPGYLANLSTSPRTPGSAEGAHGVPLFPSMSAPDWQGVVRVLNRSPEAGEVRIVAMDDTAYEYEALTLSLDAHGAAHFNSTDLEIGNAAKGLTGSAGAGSATWRLDLTGALDIEVLSYVRTIDGFLTPVHDLVPLVDGAHRVVFFNPASNRQQRSRLRVINAGESEATVTVTGVDDAGRSPGGAVSLKVAAGTALEVGSGDLESGEGDSIVSGALGDGEGKWRLRVESDRPVQVMSLLDSPTGHLTNLSAVAGPVADP